MFCWNCGKAQEGNTSYCFNCGVRLSQEPASQPDTAPALEVKYAGFWKRLLAWILDIIAFAAFNFVIGIIVAVALVAAGVDETTAGNVVAAIYNINIFVGGWLYYALFERSHTRGTIGKMTLGIIVTDSSGNKISFARATGRHFAKIISIVILLIGYFMIAFTGKKQGLHDIIADTLVIQR